MNKNIIILSTLIIIFAITTSSVGLFWINDGEPYYLENVNGDKVEIFGEGLYATESSFKAPINKGTDTIILFVVVPLFIITVFLYNKDKVKVKLLHLGLLACLFYYAASISFGVSYNILFLIYILLFSCCLFTFIIGIIASNKQFKPSIIQELPHKSVIIFLLLAGLSVFVWLIEIVSSIITGVPPSIIGMNTTEPTFVIDIGIIAPTCFYSAMLVYKRKPLGYIFSIILLTLNAMIGLIVVSQTIFQRFYGVSISLEEFIPYVVVFVVMSLVATLLNFKILKNIHD